MEKAVIYASYSCENQTEQSIEGQLRVCEDYAKNKGILILHTYIDRAMSGTNDNRPDFQKMIKESQKREWNYVIVYKLDRFSRNKYEMAMHKKTLKDNGVKLVSATEYIPDSPEAIIIESMLEGYAEYYSAELSQKVKRGMKESRLKGNYTGGVLLYGYKVENHKLLIDEEKAEVVRFIFAQYALGKYVKDILNELNARQITNKGKPFVKHTIYNILRNEKYAGIYRCNNELYDNVYPAIVPLDTFETVRAKVEKLKHGKTSQTTVYLLREKIKCGYCGNNMYVESGTQKNGKIKRYYKCSKRKAGEECNKSNIRKDELEEFILNAVIDVLGSPSIMSTIIKHLLEIQEKGTTQNVQLIKLNQELRGVENSLSNIMKAMELGIMNNTTQKRMLELETRQQILQKEIYREKSKEIMLLDEDDIKTFYKDALALEPVMLINYLIKEIVLFNDRVDIYFKNPLKTEPYNSQDSILLYTSRPHSIAYTHESIIAKVLV